MFQNNRNKQKTNQNSSKFVKISTFLIPHTISSVCFGCFDTVPKQRNKLKKLFFGFAKTQTEKQPKQIEFRFVLVRTEKEKFNSFEDDLVENFFWRFFWFVLVCFGCFDTGPKHRNKPKKNVFWFHETNEKQPKRIEFQFVSVRTEKN